MKTKARYLKADRQQPRWDMVDLESQLPADHRARIVWSFVKGLDLSGFYGKIKALEDMAGRPPPDPAVLLSLWLYGTLEGVGSARQLARLCERDTAYRWICGGVPVNYHGLSDFRGGHADLLDQLLTDSVTALLSGGVVTLEEIAVDGTKVQASAGRGSFRRAARLATFAAAAKERVAQLKGETEGDPGAGDRRRRAAALRAAESIEKRAAAALEVISKLREEKTKREKTHKKEEEKKGEPRASLTDPEARRMRFADGAVRAGYNVQLAVLPGSGVIVGVDVSDRRNDDGLARPMVEQIGRRYRCRPRRLLVDTRYATQADIQALSQATHGADGIEVYSPPPPEKPDASPESQRKRRYRRAREPQGVAAWRARMNDPASQKIYRRRGWIETVNGLLKARTLRVMTVRSMIKVRCVALLNALAHNLWRVHRMAAVPATV